MSGIWRSSFKSSRSRDASDPTMVDRFRSVRRAWVSRTGARFLARSHRRGAVVILAAAVLGACTAASESGAQASPSPSASTTVPSAAPSATEPGETVEPTGVTPAASSPSPVPAAPSATPTSPLAPAPTRARATLPAVKPKETAKADSGVSVDLTGWRSISVEAGGPGEIGGPGVAIDLRVVNGSRTPVDLTNVVVDLRYGGDRTPAIPSDRSPAEPFSERLEPGGASSATYAFRIDTADRDKIVLLVSLDPDVPVVVFRGALA